MRPPIHVVQWWKNGDHPHDRVGKTEVDWPATIDAHPELVGVDGTVQQPDDAVTYVRSEGAVVRFYRHPDFPGADICGVCGHIMHDHGWIDQGVDGIVVCPGDLIVTADYEAYRVVSQPDS